MKALCDPFRVFQQYNFTSFLIAEYVNRRNVYDNDVGMRKQTKDEKYFIEYLELEKIFNC